MKQQKILCQLETLLIILLFLCLVKGQNKCNFYVFDPEACIVKTSGISCYYDYFENKCLKQIHKNRGCSDNLNYNSCIQQLTDFFGNEVRCIFGKRCQEANEFHLKNLGCNDKFSKYACLNVDGMCKWTNKCEKLLEEDVDQTLPCVYPISVTLQACQNVQTEQCKSTGFQGEYICDKIKDEELVFLKCETPGLNEVGCISLTLKNQYCIFENQRCQSIKLENITSCTQRVNLEACSQIKHLKCQWRFQSCYDFIEENKECNELEGVSQKTCTFSNQLCYYDENKKKCQSPTTQDLEQLTCDSIGLSKAACLKIKNQKCTFYYGYCQQISDMDLKRYKCEADLNEEACLNIRTQYEFCLWDGNKCSSIQISQDIDCPLTILEKNQKINGNVCQAISKKNVTCKYDDLTHLCIEATSNDNCDSSFINKEGCLRITNKTQACIWSELQCKKAEVIQFKTTCTSLGFANPIACSQIHENNQLGCYLNSNIQMCEELIIDLPKIVTQDILNQNYNAKLLLNQFSCSKLGINKVICASITTEGQRCYWAQNECKKVKKISDISKIICLDMQYANFQTCAIIKQGKEPCRYFNQVKGCINSINNNMTCNYPGLNIFACSQVPGQCYYNNEEGRCESFDENSNQASSTTFSLALIEKLECVANSPSKSLCVAILTIGQLCKWSQQFDTCVDERVQLNQQCSEFAGSGISVNANVCASIIMSFPDYNPKLGPGFDISRGYCTYNQVKAQCEIRIEACKTLCCTEKQAYGINAHTCSKFGSKEPGIYCYFNNLRCEQLSEDKVDITNQLLVQQYFDANKMTCNQMGKNSCHMLTWSKKQLCFYNGNACLNLDLSFYPDMSRFVAAPAILNEYACLAIEGVITDKNKVKYIGYDSVNKFCKILQFNTEFPFLTCEDAIGNRNVCLRYTGNNYCKWDPDEYKCITMSETEVMEIDTCNYNQNIKACYESKTLACQFSYDRDLCIDAPHDVGCSYFDKSGPVSEQVCKQITRAGQVCKYDNKNCVIMTKVSTSCSLPGSNMIGCYMNTVGPCRWNPINSECYQNQTEISELKCTDYLNKSLCLQITSEACYWNIELTSCQKFKEISAEEFLKFNTLNTYNQLACFLITKAGYYFNSTTNKCMPLTSDTYKCQDYQMNEYACLFLTKGHKCYFDSNEKLQNIRCKNYDLEQTICQTKNKVNIDVCMDIPRTCYFDQNSLQCVSIIVEQSTFCSTLTKNKVLGYFYNKLTCSSIDIEVTEPFGDQQCYQYDNFIQQCHYEKYCQYLNYGCSVFETTISRFDPHQHQQIDKKVCTDLNGKIEYANQTCATEASSSSGNIYVQNPQIQSDPKCTKTPDNTTSSTCMDYADPSAIMLLNGVEIPETNKTQSYQTICIPSSKGTSNDCQQSYECGQYFIKMWLATIQTQTCKYGICNFDKTSCSSTCPDLTTYADTDIKQEFPIITPQSCNTANCDTTATNCFCSVDKAACRQDSNCFKIVTNPSVSVFQKTCKTLQFFINRGYCLIVPVKINQCLNTYSKGLCLQIVEGVRCFFDIKQGGCRQYIEKEDKLPSCNSFYNGCKNSYSSNAICKMQSKQEYPETCQTIKNQFEICTEAGGYNGSFQCSDVPAEDAQPRICSKANDDCRFLNGQCSSSFPIQNPDKSYNCDVTFSKSLCEKCGCKFDFAGFCQQIALPPQINADQSNKYYLCQEVNLRSIASQSQNCGLVDQACRYDLECEDATQMMCSDLIGYVSSYKACIRCPELRMRYDDTKLQCLIQNQTIEQCDNLNKLACLSLSRKNMCVWKDQKCKQILFISNTDSTDCTIYNYNACYQVKNLCWFDPITQLCQQFDPLKAECQYLLNEQACKLSMKESCQWNSLLLVCEKLDQIPIDKCTGLNKYSCLHHPNLPCGWSDSLIKCEQIIYAYPITSCSKFLASTQASIITQQNSITCTRMQIASNCFLDKYYHCRETISTDILYCNTPGVNKQACLQRTINNCQFLNGYCEEQLSKDVSCQVYLNKQACLNQNNHCQFQSQCLLYTVTNLTQITSSNNLYPYSSSVCSAFDQNKNFTSSLIYSTFQGKCLDVSLRVPFIDKCEFIGVNKYACLSKTNTYCIYKDQSCQTVSLKQVLSETDCLQNYNWKSCILLPPGCKFLNFECIKIKETDNCQTLSSEKSLIQSTVCLKTTDVACRFENYQCQIIKTPQKCSAEGLNYLGCIFQTKGSMCSHNGIECQYNYETVTCDQKVNEDKCLSNRSKSQFCTFDTKGCKYIDNSANKLDKCLNFIKTNPTTCTQAKDYPCYYDIPNKQCIYYFNPTDYTNIPINYHWINSISLNQQACEQFNVFDPVRWQDGCTKVLGSQLLYLKCNQLLNRISCISIKTPFQYCMYVDNKCIQQNLDDFKTKDCDKIIDINTGIFCQVTQNVACKYTQYKFGCDIVKPDQNIDCVETDTEIVGYNKLACLMNQNQCYYDEICFKLNKSGLQFCSDVKQFNKDTCRLITSEGCTQKNNQCVKLYNQDYFQIQCTDAINKFACVLIQTKDQYCNFNGENCIQLSVKAQRNSNCINIININHFSYCEQPGDVPCKYDQKQSACKAINEMEEFSCDRGLNQLGCLNYTDKKLQCNFLSYCYGPNFRIQNCIQLENNDCCNEAFSIETCLFQKLFLCQWINNKCQKYNQVENPICNNQTFSSFQVCSSIIDVSCIFNIDTFGCEEVISKSCDIMQTPQQCSRIKNLPCVWNSFSEICLYKTPEIFEDCNDIDKLQGSQRACTNVIKEAQKCIYKDYHCINSLEEETNNCKSNINIILCLQQKKQPCYWKLTENLIKKFSDDQEQIVYYGKCIEFNDYSITGCNSNLSYQSCLGITKIGAFCVWLNGACQEIQQYKGLIYKYNEVALINVNVCGLINDGQSVYYDNFLSTCNLTDNQKEVNCNPFNPGLNELTCIQIQGQNCIWEDQKKICIPQNDNAIKFITECYSGLSFELCSQVEGTQACAILDNKCQQVNLETINCNNIGLNKYGCLNIKKYACIWQQVDRIHQCSDYIPYTSCLFLPNNINYKVCQQVTEDACYYDEVEMKCASPLGKNLNCDSLGLNIIGCVQIDECYFDQKCQKIQIQNYYCNQFPQANYKICQNAIDNCKYNEITHGCSQTYEEQCEQKGLSQQGCLSQNNCIYLNNECICKDLYDFYNLCHQIQDSKTCSQNQRCYFETIKDSKLSSDLLGINSVGRCRIKTCEDLKEKECSGRIVLQKTCYLDNSNKCQSALTCEDIKNSKFNCEQFTINNNPCRSLKQFNKCKTLECKELNEITCKNFMNQCKFNSVCEQKKCRDYEFSFCILYGCDWNYITNRCQEQVNCYEILTSRECNQKKQKGQQCVWVNLENRNICSVIGCRYIPKGKSCSGMIQGDEVCVELQDLTCVSCEEIQSACQCLQVQQNCYYDDINQQCKSKTCELFESTADCSQQYCFLEGQGEKQKCLRKCDYLFNQDQCEKQQYCSWNNGLDICQVKTDDEQDSQKIFNEHNQNYELIFKALSLMFALLL